MEKKVFIPIKVKFSRDTKMWYMDITDASLSELIELREKLIGINEDAISILDGIIRENIGYMNSEFKLKRRETNKIKEPMRKRKQLIKTLRKRRR